MLIRCLLFIKIGSQKIEKIASEVKEFEKNVEESVFYSRGGILKHHSIDHFWIIYCWFNSQQNLFSKLRS